MEFLIRDFVVSFNKITIMTNYRSVFFTWFNFIFFNFDSYVNVPYISYNLSNDLLV